MCLACESYTIAGLLVQEEYTQADDVNGVNNHHLNCPRPTFHLQPHNTETQHSRVRGVACLGDVQLAHVTTGDRFEREPLQSACCISSRVLALLFCQAGSRIFSPLFKEAGRVVCLHHRLGPRFFFSLCMSLSCSDSSTRKGGKVQGLSSETHNAFTLMQCANRLHPLTLQAAVVSPGS